MSCAIDNCSRKIFARSMCKTHWRRWRKHGDPRHSTLPGGIKKHGHCSNHKTSAEYTVWVHMLQRCTNPRCKAWENYGARGISVCERWRKFELFLEDVGARPSPSHSLDRYPNNNGNYEPGNVRWATRGEQMRNRRNNHLLTFQGETMCLSDWAARLGVTYQMLQGRIAKGQPLEKVLSTQSQLVRGANGRFIPADEIDQMAAYLDGQLEIDSRGRWVR